MYRKISFLLILFQISLTFAENEASVLKLELPIFDIPYQTSVMDFSSPSMNQSMAITINSFSAFHFGMKKFYDNSEINETLKKIIYYSGIGIGDMLIVFMPGGPGWLHEEYHRAILSLNGVKSFNGMYAMPFGDNNVAVSKILDEDLIRFKKKKPHDFVRAHAAGKEAENLFISNLQRNNFFYNQEFSNEFIYIFATLNSHLSMINIVNDKTNDEIKKINEQETSVSKRDFTGFDYLSWTYDLFRPNEPYEARGIHPSGIGINRYRSPQDLTNEELKYLKQQRYWHILNYISPMMIGIKTIPIGENGIEGNFALRHNLTSFGTDASAQIYFKKQPFNFIFTYHNYQNYRNYFPAIEVELLDYPFNIGNFGMFFSSRIIVGLQPEEQKFKTEESEFLGLFGLRADFMVNKYFLPYIDFAVKTDGWVAGNEYLDRSASVKAGISARF